MSVANPWRLRKLTRLAPIATTSIHPPAVKHLENLENFETNDSRIVRTQVKEIIHNWIGKKTVDSLSYIARFRVCKRWNELMLVCCSWFGYVFLAFEQSMCMVNYVCIRFSLIFDFRQWMENVPIQVSICLYCLLLNLLNEAMLP